VAYQSDCLISQIDDWDILVANIVGRGNEFELQTGHGLPHPWDLGFDSTRTTTFPRTWLDGV